MKILKKALIIIISLFILIGAIYFFWLSPRYVIPILMYHRLGDENKSLFVTPENFEKQMAYLKYKDYTVITLDELVEGINQKKVFKKPTVVITIDDGYKDTYIFAYPILKNYRFPATIFLTAYSLGKEEFLDLNEIKIMAEDNISFGSHTKNHVYLPSIAEKNILEEEIAGSKNEIQNKTGFQIDYFCYPTGGFNEEIKEIVKNSGYKGACTTNRGFDKLNKDVYELKRVKITNADMNKPWSFRAKLSGYYSLFRSRKKGN